MPFETLIWLLPLPPLLAFFLIITFAYRRNSLSHGLAIGAVGLSWLGSMFVFWRALQSEHLAEHPWSAVLNWIPTGDTWFQIGVQADPLTVVTLFFVAWTILMIFIYSAGYHNYGQPRGVHDRPGLPPQGAEVKDAHGHHHRVPSIEPMYARFFALVSLFAFAMYLLVVSDNLLTLYIGWEVMGLCSYLLIGFWYAKESARNAAVKAFLTTRIGDVFMLLGLAALYALTGSLNYRAILGNPQVLEILASTISPVAGLSWAALIGLLLFAGTVGKSAQFPLHVWLPDAMEGPTPVSAMIHAATMVSAGVYLMIRFFPLLSAGWMPGEPLTPPMVAMAFIGAFTALFAATIGLAQRDIKRVLAYSTISQLGYMIAALGIGAYVAATFHLVTHAFFKALLFLASGSVIHGMEHGVYHTDEHVDPQDMFNMGGLRHKMPVTFWTFLVGGLSLAGFPLITAGFWSKDEILTAAFQSNLPVFITLGVAALLTAFYTMRQLTLVFLGQPRTAAAAQAQESRLVMTIPLVVLAIFALAAGWVGIPASFPLVGGILPNWFEAFVGSMLGHVGEADHLIFTPTPLLVSVLASLGGLFLGWWVYQSQRDRVQDMLAKPLGGLYRLWQNKYYIDELYQLVFIRPALWVADVFTYHWLDRKIIDGVLHGIGRLGLAIGHGFREFIDRPLINGAGDALADGTHEVGARLRILQPGRLQVYLLIALVGILLIGLVLFSIGMV